MFCCKAKDGASPVKKSRKVQPIAIENKDEAFKINSLSSHPENSLDNNVGQTEDDTPLPSKNNTVETDGQNQS